MDGRENETMIEYTRTFSKICGLQEACTVSYHAENRQGIQYLLVTRHGVRNKTAVCTLPPDLSQARVRQAALFLYENAIQPETAGDVLTDVCALL